MKSIFFATEPYEATPEMCELKSGRPATVQKRPEDTLYATLSIIGGLVGTYSCSVAAPGESQVSVQFCGSEGSLAGLRSLAFGEAIRESAFIGDVVYVDVVLSGKRGIYFRPL